MSGYFVWSLLLPLRHSVYLYIQLLYKHPSSSTDPFEVRCALNESEFKIEICIIYSEKFAFSITTLFWLCWNQKTNEATLCICARWLLEPEGCTPPRAVIRGWWFCLKTFFKERRQANVSWTDHKDTNARLPLGTLILLDFIKHWGFGVR